MKTVVVFILIAAFLVMQQCTGTSAAGPGSEGNGSETVARGVIVDSVGIPKASVPVKLWPADFDPVTLDTLPSGWKTMTNSNGEYCLTGIPEGTYSIEAGSAALGVKALVMSITVLDTDTEKIINTGWLQKTGAFIVNMPDLQPSEGDYVYLPGTSVFTVLSSDDCKEKRVILNSVPTGIFSELVYVSKKDHGKTDIFNDSVTIASGDTVVSAFTAWRYRSKLLLNTAVSGAGITGNVYGFPVLVRLNTDIFDFSHSKSDGGDVRFAREDGTLLPHEIERWDSAAGRAEVWVLVDTIYGNDSLQSITMYWGNTAATITSGSSDVFDTADGFEGVWHLGDDPGNLFRDATSGHFDGYSTDTAQPQPAGGVIGNCRTFDGISDFITVPNSVSGRISFPEKGEFSLFAWVYLDATDNVPHPVIGKGNTQYCLQSIVSSVSSTTWEFVEFCKSSTWQVSVSTAAKKEWTLLAAVRQGNRQLLYCNGVLVDSSATEWQQVFPRDTLGNLSIGRFVNVLNPPSDPGYSFFKGSIDEVRVVSAACSSDWMRLCYMNQRSDDRLIIMK